MYEKAGLGWQIVVPGDTRLRDLKEALFQLSGEEWWGMFSRTGLGDGLTLTNSYTDWD